MKGSSESEPRLCSKKSIHKAYTLLRSLRPEKTKNSSNSKKQMKKVKSQGQETKKKIVSSRQLKKLILNTNPHRTRLPFHESLILEELRVMMGKHNWNAVHKLYPLCGINIRVFQPIRFSYAFLLHLCSTVTNEVHFENFLSTCIDYHIIEKGTLERLMTLRKMRKSSSNIE